jgi:UDP-N-acetylglucosamine acyltransferase
VRIGHHAIIGGMSGVEKDVIPYGSVMGERADLSGLNLVGLKRHQYSRETIHALRNAYKDLFEQSEGTLADRARKLRANTTDQEVIAVLDFLEQDSSRSFCTPKHTHASAA